MWWGKWQERERDLERRRETQHDAGIWLRGAGGNVCREQQWGFVTSHVLDLNWNTLSRNQHRNGAWAPEMGSPGNTHGLWTYKDSPGKGELRKSYSDSYLPICFCFPCEFWTCFKCILTLKWVGLKFPGKSVRRNRGLEEGHYSSPENPRIAVPQESRHSKLLFFLVHIFPAGTRTVMQMFCPAVMPSTQLGVCSDGGRSFVEPGWAMLCHYRGTHGWWEGFGSCRHQGKTLCFHTDEIIEWENCCSSSPKFPSVLLSFILNLDWMQAVHQS